MFIRDSDKFLSLMQRSQLLMAYQKFISYNKAEFSLFLIGNSLPPTQSRT